MPACTPTTRAMYMSADSVWMTLPKTTCSTASAVIPERSIALLAAIVPSSVGGTSFSDLP